MTAHVDNHHISTKTEAPFQQEKVQEEEPAQEVVEHNQSDGQENEADDDGQEKNGGHDSSADKNHQMIEMEPKP